ncbi:MAG TPA: lipoprotein-releasing ABC transporter permease subunit [Burkholderiaceae bacterium]|nr:lipoprotein-releasing ABC transporter permease subunit [Burkholderiaceae bacterium]
MSYELWIGLRYAGLTWAKKRNTQHDGFVSFIAASSMAGIALGVAALIIVLSVMSGFQTQVRDRMLSVLPHIELIVPGATSADVLADWQGLAEQAKQNPEIKGAAPFVASQAMLLRSDALAGVEVRGVDPEHEIDVSELADQVIQGSLSALKPGSYGIVLGAQLARTLGAKLGDTVMVLAPEGSISPAGFTPRMRQFTVAGLFSSGYYEYDASLAFTHFEDAGKVFRDGANSGVRLRIANMLDAPAVARQLNVQLPSQVFASDWTVNNRTWFAAVKTEKRMMFIILMLIVAVAAFNLLSSLVMAVKDKQADIAILRTLGATPREIARIFLVQGSLIGLVGTLLGVGFGALIAYNIDVIVPFIENVLGIEFLPQQIYFISQLPSNPQLLDISIVAIASLLLSLLATLYPSWRAARLQPARVLRYD